MTLRTVALALLALLVASPVLADGEVHKLMTPSDKARLEKYGETRKLAIAAAQKGDPAEVKEFNAVLARPLVAFSDKPLTGTWKCRTIKAGGDFGVLVIYDWFRCKVSDDGSGWVLEKLTGSQRTKGRFYDDTAKRAIYLGSFFIEGDPILPYGSGPKTDQVGYAFRTGPKAWRLELPAPFYESNLDIIEFKR